jgi:phosphocarrier protein
MISQPITIINKLGLHARAAAKLVKTAGTFAAHITLDKGGQEVNGKSIMGVMMLAASKGTELILKADGPDEQDAISALTELINDRFGEEE